MKLIIYTLLFVGACVAIPRHKKHRHTSVVNVESLDCGELNQFFPFIPQLRTPVTSMYEIVGECFQATILREIFLDHFHEFSHWQKIFHSDKHPIILFFHPYTGSADIANGPTVCGQFQPQMVNLFKTAFTMAPLFEDSVFDGVGGRLGKY